MKYFKIIVVVLSFSLTLYIQHVNLSLIHI